MTKSISAFIMISAVFIAITSACNTGSGYSIPSLPGTGQSTPATASTQAAAGDDQVEAQPTEPQVLATPTSASTATPSQLEYIVEDISQNTGLNRISVFGLTGEDLANVLVSIVIVLLGYLSAILLVKAIKWVTLRTATKLDDRMVEIFELPARWLVTLLFLEFATARLEPLPPNVKQILDLIYFTLFVLINIVLAWRLVDYALGEPLLRKSSPERRSLLIAFTPLLRRTLQVLILVAGLAIILKNFGFNLTALFAVLGLGGLAVSLAAKETLEDLINGFILLVDRPFQIGDRIRVEKMDTWGDVKDIGARTTQILTLDNRLVVVPNSIMGNSQVENFTSPDPSFRVDLSLGIAYGSDIDQALEVIESAILSVEEIKHDKPPQVDFVDFGDSGMTFRVIYWLESYLDIRLRTKVNKAIINALENVKIELPPTTYDINLAYKDRPDVVSMK